MPGWQKVSGHGEKKLAFCRSLCYYSRALKSTQPISGCGADGSALEWGSRGRWFKSSHSDHVGTDFTLFRRLFLPAAKKTPSTPLHLSLLSKPNPLRWASVLFFAVRPYAFGRPSVRSGRKLREIEKNIDFQVFDRTSSAVKEPFLLFCGFCLTLGFFSRHPVHPECFFISALPLTCVSHAHVSGFSTDEGE